MVLVPAMNSACDVSIETGLLVPQSGQVGEVVRRVNALHLGIIPFPLRILEEPGCSQFQWPQGNTVLRLSLIPK